MWYVNVCICVCINVNVCGYMCMYIYTHSAAFRGLNPKSPILYTILLHYVCFLRDTRLFLLWLTHTSLSSLYRTVSSICIDLSGAQIPRPRPNVITSTS